MSLHHALSPFDLGPVRVRNRVFSSAHQTGLVHEHLPTGDLLAYHQERARGGIGAIFVEASAVHPSGLLTPHTIGAYLPEVVEPMSRIAQAVHEEGTRLFVQLFHGGREQIASAPKAPALAPSAVPTNRFHVEPREISVREIDELVAGYASSAANMEQAGLDGVEISASHAYLPAQFFSPRSNHRTDRYGGSLKSRLRFTAEIAHAVRGNLSTTKAVGLRLALDEMAPGALSQGECVEIAELLATELPLDFVSFVLGDSATFHGSSFIAPRPLTAPDGIIGTLQRLTHHLPDNVAVLATTRVLDLGQADAVVAEGLADMVGMTRAHIADPHLVRKAATGVRTIPCIGCNTCIGHYHAGTAIACVMNTSTGRESVREQLPLISTRTRSTVAVVGAGPAGVAAAVAAARVGQQVTLFEKEDEIGGQLRIAGNAPDHQETWCRWRDWALRELEDCTVHVQLETTPTTEDLRGFDRVISAVGAAPYRNDAVWTALRNAGIHALDSWEALAGLADSVEGPILVADWGGDPSGLDAAEVMAASKHTVYYAYSAPAPGAHIHQYQRNGYLGRLDSLGVQLLPHQELTSNDGRPVLRNVFSNRIQRLPDGIRTVVVASGRVPAAGSDDGCAAIRVGDAAGPRSLEEATLEGTLSVEVTAEPVPVKPRRVTEASVAHRE